MVKLIVEPDIKLPVDSVASVSTEGLLGGNYIGILPGSSDTMLQPGARISRTQAAVSLESLIGQFMYSGSSKSGSDSSTGGAAGGSTAPAPGAAAAHP
jgi:phospholipid/cholesterol/gamma-HCH transport system substrate-binding protein